MAYGPQLISSFHNVHLLTYLHNYSVVSIMAAVGNSPNHQATVTLRARSITTHETY